MAPSRAAPRAEFTDSMWHRCDGSMDISWSMVSAPNHFGVVRTEMHHGIVGDDVVLALEPHAAVSARPLAAETHGIIVAMVSAR